MPANFSTHAANFTEALRTGADPRTGQFFITLPFLECTANRLLGPHIALAVNYSTLSTANLFGLGNGVVLQGVSVYSPADSRIMLSSGESWYVEPDGRIPHRKLKDCTFTPQGDKWVIRRKSGESEILAKVGDDHFVTQTLTSPLGKSLHFKWGSNGTSLLLQEVVDDTGLELCRLEWPGVGANITVWPARKEEYHLRIDLQNDYLNSITRHAGTDESTLQWRLEHQLAGDALVPVTLHHPTGMKDEMTWQSGALPCPGGGALPAVQQHTRYYQQQQPETVRTYTFDPEGNNFLGHNASEEIFGPWRKDVDHLSSMLTDSYTYSSIERVTDKVSSVTTHRTYNNYHLQTAAEKRQDDAISKNDVQYHATTNMDIEGQPPFYAFPHTYTNTLNGKVPETTQTTFDDWGNPLTTLHPDGTLETTTWFPAAGEKGLCPPEPNGFVRFIKEKVTTPPVINGYTVPSHVETYRYDALGNTDFVVQKKVTEYREEGGRRVRLSSRETEYVTDSTNPEFGRIINIIHTQYDPDDGRTGYPGSQAFSTTVDVGAGIMTQTVKSETHDKLNTTHIRNLSILSGRTLKDTDTHGIVTTYTYDSQGRILSQTHADGTEHSFTQYWQYSIAARGGQILGPVTLQYDELGRHTRTWYDGAGREVRQDVYDIDQAKTEHRAEITPAENSPYWRTASERQYDAFGRVTAETLYDWDTLARHPRNKKPSTTWTTTCQYDKWGNRRVVCHADGTETHTETDPIQSTQTVWGQSGSDKKVRSGRVVTKFDLKTHRPLTHTTYPVEGNHAEAVHQYVWDGLGHLRKETDAQGHTTEYTCDVYGRVLTQTLPDGSTVSRRYAPHLTSHHPVSLAVTPMAASPWRPTQAFDGLGRLTKTTTGGRATRYHYTAAAPQPDRVTLPSGKSIAHDYIPALGFAPKSVTADTLRQTFEYHPKTGLLLNAQEGHTVDKNHRAPSGVLTGQDFIRRDDTRSVTLSSTLAGRPECVTDITGKQTHYTCDALGRLVTLNDETLTVSQTYDLMGRLHSRTVSSIPEGDTLTTTLGYDDFSREITRTVSDGNGIRLELSQQWLNTGLLSGRTTLEKGMAVLKETFRYDSRNRLVSYTALSDSPQYLPPDAHGQGMTQQTYQYDVLNNLTEATTTLHDGSVDTATYHYDNPADPTQLMRVTHSDSQYPAMLLRYDDEGRLFMKDEPTGGTTILSYDALGRLLTAGNTRYGYDAHDRLVSQRVAENDVRELYYRGQTRVNEVSAALAGETRLIHAGGGCVGVAEGDALTLLATDRHGSPVWSQRSGQATGRQHVWSPWGQGRAKGNTTLPGFNGERTDPTSGVYHLGNGYRAYNPTLMRFHCPDSLSPFGAGGINPYTYCGGDPVNHTDPSGHVGLLEWATTGIMVASLVVDVLTIGLAIPVTTASAWAAIAVDALAIISNVLGIASNHMLDPNVNLNGVVGVGFAVIGLAFTLLGGGILYTFRTVTGPYMGLIPSAESGGAATNEITPLAEDELDASGQTRPKKPRGKGDNGARTSHDNERAPLRAKKGPKKTPDNIPASTSSSGRRQIPMRHWQSQDSGGGRVLDSNPAPDRPVVPTNGVNNAAQQKYLGIGQPKRSYINSNTGFRDYKNWAPVTN
ncbi:RHS repeat-associated core domain-containing protein [Serratia liquefaciens]|uniref:RHS repeat-associated core domain-containing protein n=1 Tax=Serratia liquefaciens TaxID=614 RepID=UPI003905BBE4